MAETPTTEKKVITLDSMQAVIDKLKQDYPTRTEVTEEIAEAGGANLTYATDEEVLALFGDTAADGGSDTP